jgi:hypothetical protein
MRPEIQFRFGLQQCATYVVVTPYRRLHRIAGVGATLQKKPDQRKIFSTSNRIP